LHWIRHTFIYTVLSIACTLLANSATAQSCIDPPDGVIGWWPGDGNSIEILEGLHGVALNGASGDFVSGLLLRKSYALSN